MMRAEETPSISGISDGQGLRRGDEMITAFSMIISVAEQV
jgi:hypothetical protein